MAHDDMPKDVLMEVLSWLPAKSLMRFKSVSKSWFSVITNPVFVEMHHARSYAREDGATLLIGNPGYCQQAMDRHSFFDCTDHQASIHEVWMSTSANHRWTTNIVHGLICFYDAYNDRMDGSIVLYNLTTRETFPLPATTKRATKRQCLLGFDPTNNEYKVLCIWKNQFKKFPYSEVPICNEVPVHSEVFTVGCKDNRWRPIDLSYIDSESETCAINGWFYDGLCHDGVLYWISLNHRPRIRAIVVFDVQHEKFESFECPSDYDYPGSTKLAHIQDHLSLVHIGSEHPRYSGKFDIALMKLIDGENSDKMSWRTEVTTCHFPESTLRSSAYRWCTSTGKVFSTRSKFYAYEYILDCYDLETGKYKELRLNHTKGVPHYEYGSFTSSPIVENITPLKT